MCDYRRKQRVTFAPFHIPLFINIFIESFAKTRETCFSVLHFITLYYSLLLFIVHKFFVFPFVLQVYYTLLHLSYYTLFRGFLQTTLI